MPARGRGAVTGRGWVFAWSSEFEKRRGIVGEIQPFLFQEKIDAPLLHGQESVRLRMNRLRKR